VILVQPGTCPNALKLRNIDTFGGGLMAVVAEAGSGTSERSCVRSCSATAVDMARGRRGRREREE
jgi:hypothetical protein